MEGKLSCVMDMTYNVANIPVGEFFLKSASAVMLSGQLKSIPADFIVQEVGPDQSLCTTVDMCNDEKIRVLKREPHNISVLNNEITKTSSYTDADVDMWLQGCIERISDANKKCEAALSDANIRIADILAITVTVPKSRAARRLTHEYINKHFPFLKTNVSTASDEDTHYSLTVEVDSSLHDLIRFGMTSSEVAALYSYVRGGRTADGAARGIRVGHGVDKSGRTEAYRVLSKAYRGLESKTVDGPCDSKCMHVRWRQQRAHKNKVLSGVEERVECVSVGRKWIVHCTLLKFNREQLDASRLISERLGVDVNAVSYAGIKDKRALTLQRCTIAIQSNDKHVLRALGLPTPPAGPPPDGGNGQDASLLSAVYGQLMTVSNQELLNYTASMTTNASDEDWVFPGTNGIAIGNVSFRQDGILRAGDLWGNAFTLRVRQLEGSGAHTSSTTLREVLTQRLSDAAVAGVPNFFGSQRMGEVYRTPGTDRSDREPIGPVIGRFLVLGDYRAAVFAIVMGRREKTGCDFAMVVRAWRNYDRGETFPVDGVGSVEAEPIAATEDILDDALAAEMLSTEEDLECADHGVIDDRDDSPLATARRKFLAGCPLRDVIQSFPAKHIRERAVLKGLVRHRPVLQPDTNPSESDTDHVAEATAKWVECCRLAIRGLPFAAKQMWINSYQSWVWNGVAAHRLGLPSSSPLTSSSKQENEFIGPGDLYVYPTPSSGDSNCRLQLSSVEHFSDVLPEKEGGAECSLNMLNVCLPLFGKSIIKYPENESGRYYYEYLERAGVIVHSSCCGLCRGGGGCLSPVGDVPTRSTERPTKVHRPNLSRDSSGGEACVCSYSCRIASGVYGRLCRLESDIGVSTKGAYRKVLVVPKDCDVDVVEDVTEGNSARADGHGSDYPNSGNTATNVTVRMHFKLPAGSFATALLRELMKNDSFI